LDSTKIIINNFIVHVVGGGRRGKDEMEEREGVVVVVEDEEEEDNVVDGALASNSIVSKRLRTKAGLLILRMDIRRGIGAGKRFPVGLFGTGDGARGEKKDVVEEDDDKETDDEEEEQRPRIILC
tara:strand:- start:181 stop:555 length:375 start_codon:yes stop_codon:yes gene_type:complete